jgi:hypothetical protein
MGIGHAIGAQPHMGETLGLLQSARAELAAAPPTRAVTANARSALSTRRSPKSAPAWPSPAAETISLTPSGEAS